MRLLALMFLAVCIMVPIGFYFQAQGNFRGRGKLEPWAKVKFPTSATVHTSEPIAICASRTVCAEARRMSLRLREAKLKGKDKDIAVANAWFDQLKDDIKFADSVLVLHADPRYTQVRILSGPNTDFEGFAYTVALEEVGTGAAPP